MRVAGYLAAPNAVIFEGLAHTMRYLFFFQHTPSVYPRRPLNKKYLALHWGKGTDECLPPEFGTILVNTADADYAHGIRDPQSITSHMHLLNGVIVTWKCKTQSITTLHSTGSDITPL
jgi:hypothetical protein